MLAFFWRIEPIDAYFYKLKQDNFSTETKTRMYRVCAHISIKIVKIEIMISNI